MSAILVVDEDCTSLQVLSDVLENAGYDVCPASSGELALARASADPPALILLDMHMHEMNGLELLGQLLDREETRNVPIILVSEATDAEQLAAGLKMGATDFVRKPVERAEVLCRVAAQMQLSQLTVSVAGNLDNLRRADVRHVADNAERSRADMDAVEKELRLQALFDNAPFGAHMYELEPDGRLVFTGYNRRAEEMLGIDYTKLMGLTVDGVFPGHDAEVAEACLKVAREGGTWEDHEYVFDSAGIAGVFELYAFSFGPNRVSVFFRDITEQRKLEIALDERTVLLTRTVIDAPFPMIIHAEDGEIIEVNKAWEEISGYGRQDIPTIAVWLEKAHGPRAQNVQEALTALYGLEHRQEMGEFTIRAADGETRVWDFSSAPLGRFRDGRRVVMSAAVDVTAQRHAEHRLGRTMRALKALSAVNGTLIHAEEEVQLLRDACQVAVSVEGGYLRAWVGYAEHDDRRSVRCVASAGREDRYFEEVAYSWADGSSETGASGDAIRTREPVIVRNAVDDPRYAHVREVIQKCGYRSVAALPLIAHDSSVFGAFVLVAAEPDAFDDHEMNLLKELADDVSFGVEALRSRTKRSEAENDLAKANTRLERAVENLTEVIGKLVELRDPYTAGHQQRVAQLATRIAGELGMSDSEIDAIRVASLVHDVGKMSVPAEILSKPGSLTPLEFGLIKVHSEAGYRIVASAHMQAPIAEFVYQHHERCDGSGYPRGLAWDEILPGSRVLMVADVVEAMMSHRPYRAGLGVDAALDEIAQGAGLFYDTETSEACIRLFRERNFAFS